MVDFITTDIRGVYDPPEFISSIASTSGYGLTAGQDEILWDQYFETLYPFIEKRNFTDAGVRDYYTEKFDEALTGLLDFLDGGGSITANLSGGGTTTISNQAGLAAFITSNPDDALVVWDSYLLNTWENAIRAKNVFMYVWFYLTSAMELTTEVSGALSFSLLINAKQIELTSDQVKEEQDKIGIPSSGKDFDTINDNKNINQNIATYKEIRQSAQNKASKLASTLESTNSSEEEDAGVLSAVMQTMNTIMNQVRAQ